VNENKAGVAQMRKQIEEQKQMLTSQLSCLFKSASCLLASSFIGRTVFTNFKAFCVSEARAQMRKQIEEQKQMLTSQLSQNSGLASETQNALKSALFSFTPACSLFRFSPISESLDFRDNVPSIS
jgi:hypothetical protein